MAMIMSFIFLFLPCAPVLNSLHGSFYLILIQPLEAGLIIILIFRTRKQKHEQVK